MATRWITFLGAAVAAAGFLIGPLVLGRQDDGSARRRFALIAIAATVGLLTTLAEPLFQTLFPPSGVDAPSLSDAIGGLPNAWFLRAPGLALAAVIASVLLARRAARATDVFTFTGAAAALIAILGLALTSHASARESWRALAIGSVVIHQWAVGLWTGGLAHLLIARPYDAEAGRPLPIQRFSRYALGLAAAGIATGVLNAGLLLPTLRSLWESDYGKVVIAKAIVLVPVLALATFHRQTLRRTLERAASAFRLTLRLETALVVVIVLGGSILALLAPPSVAESTLANLDLAAPFSPNDPAGRYVRFVLDPAGQGENEIAVSVTNGPPRFLNEENVFADAPLVTDIALVRVALVNLERATAPIEVELTVDNSGTFRSPEIQLGLDGWWRAEVVVRQLGVEDVTVPFYVLLPDPNVHGESAVDNPDEAPDAKFLFERGLNGFTSLSSVHYVQRLAGGTGAVVVADYVIHAVSGGEGASLQISTASSAVVRMNGFQWVQQANGEWNKTDGSAVVPPSEWGSTYTGATAFRLGITEQIGDHTAQMVSFFVPGERGTAAWYAWWVDLESGRVLREAMVSTGHYMFNEFDSFDSAPPITPPTE